MNDPMGTRDMHRLRWAMIVLPLVFVWVFEGVRFVVLDQQLAGDEAHLASALIMGAAIFVFATLISLYLDRAQKQLVQHNKDLTATHEVSSAVRGGLALPDLLEQSLDRIVTQTGALAGAVTVGQGDGTPLRIQRPLAFAPGMAWLGAILEEPADPLLETPRYVRRAAVDTGILDLPLIRGTDRIGALRLAFHPPVAPDISDSALIDIAGEIAGAAQLGITVANLHRREREREALYEVALQLTGRADLRDVLDAITRHARDLLGAERAIVCLSDARDATLRARIGATGAQPGPATGDQHERLAMADDGSVCLVAHERTLGDHPKNPHCPLVTLEPGDRGWAARPLRGPDGPLGELCAMRPGIPFTRADKELLGALADMAAIAVRTARLHEAEEQWTIHAERDRIARELHDSLAQVLGVIHLQLRSLESRAKDEASHAMAAELSSIADTADEAYRDVREAILGLRETVREDDGLEGSLREYLRKYSRQTGIATHLECEGDVRRALSPRAEVQLLRVVQEALTNTRKHSAARRATVRIAAGPAGTTVSVEDDGLGFDPTTVASSMEGGFGMASMRERVEQVGGTLAVHTAPNQGTRIVVRLEPEDTRGTHSAEAQGAAGR
ncbi:MAG TPA: GAF domain-containing sensor histidine kinase [Candidatus Limnocylindrales bacterium]|nr:GAF domain-containing sensor histidine kinase [Candidatus Limnocylindrales bacterium]